MNQGQQLTVDSFSRWRALGVLCLGVLMTVIDGTVVNVALPSIRTDLSFSEVKLVWVVSAYSLSYSGLLLLSGRMGDLFGQRRLFLVGIAVFTVASAGCGWANSPTAMVVARAIQGVGGAIITAVALSLVVSLFAEAGERARAMAVYSFVCCCGGSVGLLLGSALMSVLSWRWVFLVNVPIGVAVYILCRVSLPGQLRLTRADRLDIPGAAAITASCMLALYAIVHANAVSWDSVQTTALLGSSMVLFALFLYIEARTPSPLIPLRLFRRRNLAVANIIFLLWVFSISGWLFCIALYLRVILGYRPEQLTLAFLPGNLTAAVVSLFFSAKLVQRLGIKGALTIGLLLTSVGFGFFARAPLHGSLVIDVFPGMFLVGLGAGTAPNPLLLAAMSGSSPSEAGIVSGVTTTVATMGGALGLAILASAASTYTAGQVTLGASLSTALNSGYHVVYSIAAVSLIAASLVGSAFLRIEQQHGEKLSVEHTRRIPLGHE